MKSTIWVKTSRTYSREIDKREEMQFDLWEFNEIIGKCLLKYEARYVRY